MYVARERVDIQERQQPGVELEIGVEDVAGRAQLHELAYRLHRVVQTNAHVADVDFAIIQTGEDHSGPEWQRQIVAGFDCLVGEERQHARIRRIGRAARRAPLRRRRRRARRVARPGRSFSPLCSRCDQRHR